MCTIAGYNGSKPAVPELIAMCRKQQFFDSGVCTGIATYDNGKIYHAKVVGDLDVLLKETDALNFPGTIGMIHSRPSETSVQNAHPFVVPDESFAAVFNGTAAFKNEKAHKILNGFIMDALSENIIPTSLNGGGSNHLSDGRTFHPSDARTLAISSRIQKGADISDAIYDVFNTSPADIVGVFMSLNDPENLHVGRITRPMNVAVGNGETYIATSEMAFPEDVTFETVTEIPVASIAVIGKGTVNQTPHRFTNFSVEEITPEVYKEAYQLLEKYFGDKEHPMPFDERPFWKDWLYIWKEKPYANCYLAEEGDFLKPEAALIYHILNDFKKQGRLHSVYKDFLGKKTNHFYVDPV